jgi:hypothetical protein
MSESQEAAPLKWQRSVTLDYLCGVHENDKGSEQWATAVA